MTVVLVRGCFDLLHVGHIRHLQEARGYGDFLAVSLTTDAAIKREKGDDRPVIDERERMEMLQALDCVSDVSLDGTWHEAMDKWKPLIFAKGSDAKDSVPTELVQYCAKHGITILHTKPNPQTTSWIIDRIRCR